MDALSHKGSHLRVAPASRLSESNERTDERTDVAPNNDCDIPAVTATCARVQADDAIGLGEVIAAGFIHSGGRFPRVRSGEREPIAQDVRLAVYRRDGGRCVACGCTWTEHPLELDHITPWSAGGSDNSTNLRTLCRPCNTARSNYDDGANGKRVLPVTWWCIDCHGPKWEYVSRPEAVRRPPSRIEPRAGLTFAYCATCDINSYAEVTL